MAKLGFVIFPSIGKDIYYSEDLIVVDNYNKKTFHTYPKQNNGSYVVTQNWAKMKEIQISIKKDGERRIKEFDSYEDAIQWLVANRPKDDLIERRREALRRTWHDKNKDWV